jgi:predicted anti-sigma-YlaC factor YlaD
MNEHVTLWLGAYHDGELRGRRLQQVEAHLAHCAACRAELDELRALTALLQESPAAQVHTSPERFVAQVGLRLARRPAQPAWKSILEVGWRMAPVGLLASWAFVQVVLAVASTILYAVRIDVIGNAVASWLPPFEESWLTQIAHLSGTSLNDASMAVLRLLSLLSWSTMLNLIVLLVIGLLYWSWLASWWARRQHRNVERA